MGGIRLVDKSCNRCNINYKGIWNQELCNKCKQDGYECKCKFCQVEFLGKSKGRVVCDTCFKSHRHVREREYCGDAISKGKIKFFQTKKGKEVAKRVGKINSKKMLEFNKTPIGIETKRLTAEKTSRILKNKIANGEFTPKITNSRTHWDAKIILESGQIKKFRSSWEAVFWNSNQYLEFETLRIPWIDQNGESHSYIPDFFDREKNIVYEIKPRSSWGPQNFKMQQSIKWCMNNNIKFIWINETNIWDYIDENDFIHPDNLEQLNKVKNGIKKS